MLKKVVLNSPDAEPLAPTEEPSVGSVGFSYSQEKADEMKALEAELHQKADALSQTEIIDDAPLSATDNVTQLNAQDKSMKEFVTLLDFIKNQHSKAKKMKNPGHKAKLSKLQNYHKMKDKEFKHHEIQKGLQLNKAV